MKIGDVEDNIKGLKKHSITDWLILLLIVLMVVTIGMFLVNETSEFIYNTKLLSSPCSLCEELNPHIECSSPASSVQFALG